MSKNIKSLLNELGQMVPERNKYLVIEAKADHLVNSGIRLLEQIEKNFEPELAEELTKRLVNSLKARDFGKFQRKIRSLNESNEDKTDE